MSRTRARDEGPLRHITVILLPSGDNGVQLLDVARRWSGLDLLRRSIWIVPENIDMGLPGPASAIALLLGSGQDSEVDAFGMLGHSDVSEAQLIVLQTISEDGSADGLQVARAKALFSAMRAAVPQPLHSGVGSQVDLVALNVVAAPTGVSGVDPEECLFHHFDANLVVSPEDRRSAGSIDHFVRPGGSLRSWALAQAIAVAGLWSGMTDSPWASLNGLEDRRSVGSAQGTQVTPVRGFARAVSSAPMARRAVTTAMQSVVDNPLNVLAESSLAPAADPEPVVAEMLIGLDRVDGGRISYESPTPQPGPGRVKIGFLKAIGAFLRVSASLITGVPRFVVDRGRARMGARATKVLSGKQGNETVIFDGIDKDKSEFEDSFERRALDNEQELATLNLDPPAPAPVLWRTVRGAVFALLDGSPVPDGMPAPQVNGQRVVAGSLPVVVPPPDAWFSDVGADVSFTEAHGLSHWVVTPCSPRDHSFAASALQAVQARVDGERSDVQDRIAELKSKISSKPAGKVDEAAQSDVLAQDPPAAGTDALRADIDRLKSALSALNGLGSVVAANQVSLQLWLDTRRASLLWRLAAVLEQRTVKAHADADVAFKQATEIPGIDFDEPRRIRNQFAKRFLVWLPATAILLLLLARYVSLEWMEWAALGMLLVLLFLLVLSYRRRSRFLATIRRLQHEQRDAARRCREIKQAAQRLDGLYQQMVDWGQILADGVYEPWSCDPAWATSVDEDLQDADLPACVGLAVPDPDDARAAQQVQAVALRTIAGVGWRARAFQKLEELSLREQDSVSEPDVDLIDRDSLATPNGTRSYLLGSLLDDRLKETAGMEVMKSGVERLYDEEFSKISQRVQVVNGEIAPEEMHILSNGQGLKLATPEWPEYLEEVLDVESQLSNYLWSNAGKSDPRARQSMTTLGWAPNRGFSVSGTETLHRGRIRSPAENRGVEQSVRLDFGPAIDHDYAFLFSDEASPFAKDRGEPPMNMGKRASDDMGFF